MKDGFIKSAAISPEIKVADCEFNANNIMCELEKASNEGVKLAVFPELAITGATCGDLFLQPILMQSVFESLIKIQNFTLGLNHEIITAIGTPLEINGNLYNTCIIIHKGNFIGATALKSKGMNQKYFRDYLESSCIETRFGLFGNNIVFRAASNKDFSFSTECMKFNTNNIPPASIIVNPYAEEEIIGSYERRLNRIKQRSLDLCCGYVCAGSGYGESTTDMVFSGHCLIVENGKILTESKPFEYKNRTPLAADKLWTTERTLKLRYKSAISEIDVSGLSAIKKACIETKPENKFIFVDFDMDLSGETVLTRYISKLPFISDDRQELENHCELVLTMQAYALKKRMEHVGAKCIVLGLSGGLDSTLALLAAIKAMEIMKDKNGKPRPYSDIILVTMPCFGTSQRTRRNAEILAAETGADFRTIDITEAVIQHFKDIGHDINNHNAVFENAQARERTQVLMDIANSENGFMLGTSDLSELALGWTTYNGDHMSMYGINSGVPKTLMREIVRYAAKKTNNPALRDVLEDILDTPISPELLPVKVQDSKIPDSIESVASEISEMSQKTEDLVGPYELHDFFIYYALTLYYPPKKILRVAENAFKNQYPRDVILKWLKNFYKRFFSQQYKRSCMTDGVKILSISFSPRKGLDMPSDAVSNLWLRELEGM